jgi:hypothetical protein
VPTVRHQSPRTATALAGQSLGKVEGPLSRFMLNRNRCLPSVTSHRGQCSNRLAGQSLGKAEGPLRFMLYQEPVPTVRHQSPRKRLWCARVWEKLEGPSFRSGAVQTETGAYRPSPSPRISAFGRPESGKVEGPLRFMLLRNRCLSVTSHRQQPPLAGQSRGKSWRDLFGSCYQEPVPTVRHHHRRKRRTKTHKDTDNFLVTCGDEPG